MRRRRAPSAAMAGRGQNVRYRCLQCRPPSTSRLASVRDPDARSTCNDAHLRATRAHSACGVVPRPAGPRSGPTCGPPATPPGARAWRGCCGASPVGHRPPGDPTGRRPPPWAPPFHVQRRLPRAATRTRTRTRTYPGSSSPRIPARLSRARVGPVDRHGEAPYATGATLVRHPDRCAHRGGDRSFPRTRAPAHTRALSPRRAGSCDRHRVPVVSSAAGVPRTPPGGRPSLGRRAPRATRHLRPRTRTAAAPTAPMHSTARAPPSATREPCGSIRTPIAFPPFVRHETTSPRAPEIRLPDSTRGRPHPGPASRRLLPNRETNLSSQA